MTRRRVQILLLALLAATTAGAQTPAPPGAPEEEKPRPGIHFVMKKHPSLRFGKAARIDFRAKFQGDFRDYSPTINRKDETWDVHRKRLGIEGEFLKYFEYQIEREFRDVLYPWKDVYLNMRFFPDAQIQVGKFKEPFSLEQLTGATNLDFVYRSFAANLLAPGRDTGVMVHGRFFKRGLNYQAGIFRQDGELARSREIAKFGTRLSPTSEEVTVAARLTGTPFRLFGATGALRNLELGAAMTTSKIPEGLNGIKGETIEGFTFFEPLFVRGRRTRAGAELNFNAGPAALKGEFVHVQDERLGQGIANQDLPDAIARAWYLTGTWLLTGEPKADDVEPQKQLFGGGVGAVELAVRYEQLRFGSATHPGTAFRNPRAANVLENRDRAWSFGVNWYPNRFLKIQGNAIREQIEDTERSPIFGRDRFWTFVGRLQFVL